MLINDENEILYITLLRKFKKYKCIVSTVCENNKSLVCIEEKTKEEKFALISKTVNSYLVEVYGSSEAPVYRDIVEHISQVSLVIKRYLFGETVACQLDNTKQ